MKHPKNKYANDVHCIIDEADAPKELWEISEKWRELADAEGDVGSCVMGAGFIFKYQKKWYFLIPRSRWQGSISCNNRPCFFRSDCLARKLGSSG